MASMSTEIAVLRALLRLSRRRTPATITDLLDRVGGDAIDVQRALASLARAQLVQRSGESARLSLAGLAVAVAATATANARRAKTVARPSKHARHPRPVSRVVSIARVARVKRHHAA
jgi:DNA-binding IclR family transcriptional regulator